MFIIRHLLEVEGHFRKTSTTLKKKKGHSFTEQWNLWLQNVVPNQ